MLLGMMRKARVLGRQALGSEPWIRREVSLPLEFHGNDYCGWSVPRGGLRGDSVVVDVGLGEDMVFSLSLMDRYGLTVHGFDPTPRALAYAAGVKRPGLEIHPFGLAARDGEADFYLPNDSSHVSGSLVAASHVGRETLKVSLIGMATLRRLIGGRRINVLKMDIEGAEYDVINSIEFEEHAPGIDVLCVEFHHRWKGVGVRATTAAVERLRSLVFRCTWLSSASNEEFTFVRQVQRS